jgi:hypothetical protein
VSRIKSFLAAIAALAATLAALDLTGIIALMPQEVAKWVVIVPSAAAAVVHFAQSLRENLDKYGLAIAISAALFLPSCAGLSFTVSSPWGDASSQDGGPLSITPRPIIIPAK